MDISEVDDSGILEVQVSFYLIGQDLDPDAVTAQLGITPDTIQRRGHERCPGSAGKVMGMFEKGLWGLGSHPHVSSNDVNKHLRWVLNQVLPHRAAILEFARGGEVCFDVPWKFSHLYSSTIIAIDADCLTGIAALGGGIGCDICHVPEPAAESGLFH